LPPGIEAVSHLLKLEHLLRRVRNESRKTSNQLGKRPSPKEDGRSKKGPLAYRWSRKVFLEETVEACALQGKKRIKFKENQNFRDYGPKAPPNIGSYLASDHLTRNPICFYRAVRRKSIKSLSAMP